MKITGLGQLLRIFVGESDRYKRQPIDEYIVLKAREMGLAGATVIKGNLGYGATTRIHSAKILRLSDQLPVVIEIVDSEKRIDLIRNEIDMIFEESGCGGLVTIENIEIVKYAPGKKE